MGNAHPTADSNPVPLLIASGTLAEAPMCLLNSPHYREFMARQPKEKQNGGNRRGIEADLGDELEQAEGSWAANADSFHRDLHKPSASETPRRMRARRANEVRQHLKADYILANPPFNMSDWGGDRLRDDSRWKYGAPPVGNGNEANVLIYCGRNREG